MEKRIRYIVEVKTKEDSEWTPLGWGTGLFSDLHYFDSPEQAEDYIDRISKVTYAARIIEVVEKFTVITEFPNLSLR